MKKIALCAAFIAVLLISSTATAQYRSLPVPEVSVNDLSVTFQRSLYPEYYVDVSAINDMNWVRAHDSTLTDFWRDTGPSILHDLSELSGIDWIEPKVEIYLVRFYPDVGGPDPLVIPVGGIKRGHLTQAAPTGNQMKLNLIYQLAHRMLAQADKSDDPFMRSMAGHPLMRPGIFRRDNLAMLLTLVTAQRVMGLDSTYDAYRSTFWRERTPGREILEQYLLSEWILSSSHTLSQWVIGEPYTSQLVIATRPPRRTRPTTTAPRSYIEGLPLKGRLGFSVIWNAASRLQIDKIDITRLGYASGLMEGDEIRSVDGVRVRNQKDMVERILAGLDSGGATVTVMREGQTLPVIIQPMDLLMDEMEYWEEDSLYFDIPPTLMDKPEDTTQSEGGMGPH